MRHRDARRDIDIKNIIGRSEEAEVAGLGDCPRCGSPLTIRSGRDGRFIACSAYHLRGCKYTRSLSDSEDDRLHECHSCHRKVPIADLEEAATITDLAGEKILWREYHCRSCREAGNGRQAGNGNGGRSSGLERLTVTAGV